MILLASGAALAVMMAEPLRCTKINPCPASRTIMRALEAYRGRLTAGPTRPTQSSDAAVEVTLLDVYDVQCAPERRAASVRCSFVAKWESNRGPQCPAATAGGMTAPMCDRNVEMRNEQVIADFEMQNGGWTISDAKWLETRR